MEINIIKGIEMFYEIDFEKIIEYFETNKGNVYFFSVESLETIDNPEAAHFFFQNVLNKNITKEDFILAENKIIALLEYLYIRNTKVYSLSGVCENDEKFQKFHYVKKSAEVKAFLNLVKNNIDKRIEIKDINILKGFAIIGIREIGSVCLCFDNPELAVMVDECKGIIYFKNIDDSKEFLDVAKRIGLNIEKWKAD